MIKWYSMKQLKKNDDKVEKHLHDNLLNQRLCWKISLCSDQKCIKVTKNVPFITV